MIDPHDLDWIPLRGHWWRIREALFWFAVTAGLAFLGYSWVVG